MPRFGRFDAVYEKELCLLYCLVEEIPVSLSWLIICEMKLVHKKKKNALPYGMFLTYIFRDFGINLKIESGHKLTRYEVYNSSSLHRMGIQKIGHHWFRKKGASDAHDGNEPSESRDEERSSSPIPLPNSPPSEQQTANLPSSSAHPPPAAPQSSVTFDDSFIAKLAEAVYAKFRSEGWTAPPSTSIPSSSSADPNDLNQTLVPHHAMLFEQQAYIRADIASLDEKVNNLIGRQLDIERRMFAFTTDFQTMATTLKEAIPQTDFGVAINKYTDLEKAIQGFKDSLAQVTKSMKKLREEVEGKNSFIQDSYTTLNSSQANLEKHILHVSTLLSNFLEPSTQTPLQTSAKETPAAPPMQPPSSSQHPTGKKMKTVARKRAAPPTRMRAPRSCSMRSRKRTKSNEDNPIFVSEHDSSSSHGDSTSSSD